MHLEVVLVKPSSAGLSLPALSEFSEWVLNLQQLRIWLLLVKGLNNTGSATLQDCGYSLWSWDLGSRRLNWLSTGSDKWQGMGVQGLLCWAAAPQKGFYPLGCLKAHFWCCSIGSMSYSLPLCLPSLSLVLWRGMLQTAALLLEIIPVLDIPRLREQKCAWHWCCPRALGRTASARPQPEFLWKYGFYRYVLCVLLSTHSWTSCRASAKLAEGEVSKLFNSCKCVEKYGAKEERRQKPYIHNSW